MYRLTIATAALVLGGCVHVTHDEGGRHVGAPAPLMSEAEAMAITEAANTQFEAYFLADDAAGLASLYTRDGIIMPPDAPNAQGAEAIAAYWGAVTSALYRVDLETQTAEAVSPRDIIEEVRATFYDPDDNVVGGGKAIVTWRHEDGAWRLDRDIWNGGE